MTDIATTPPTSLLEQVVVGGDLSKLSSAQRVDYYQKVCSSLGLNPLTRPFQYLSLQGRLTLYASRDATDQLRRLNRVSVTIVSRERMDDLYIVTARATLPDGRTDESIGAVAIGGLKGDALANGIMKAECVPMDSEILTRDGFKSFDSLVVGEDVLSYDCDADECKWTPLLEKTQYQNAAVHRLHTEGNQFDIECTSDHSWAIRSMPYEPDTRSGGTRGPRGPYANRQPLRRLVKACDFKAGQSIVMAAAEKQTSDSILTPVEAAILGWAVTDGTIKRVGNSVRIGICQSKEKNFETIRETVTAATGVLKETVSPARTRTFPTGRTYDTLEQHWWYLPAAISRAILDRAGFHDRCDLPRIVTRLSSPSRKAMLQAMMLAEGDSRRIFANCDPHIHDALDILCSLEGIATGRLTHKDGRLYTKRVKLTRHVASQNLSLDPSRETDVWCPTTAYGTWVMRQRGQVVITGNTKAKRRATLSVVGLGWLDETEIETIPDAHTVVEDEPKAVTPPAQPQLPPAKPANGVHCVDCDAVITARTIKGRLYTPPEIVVSTRKRFARVLCWDCAAKATKAAHEQPEPQTNLDDTADTDAA